MTGAPTRAALERRIVLLPPSAADGAIACQVLAAAGMATALCTNTAELCATAAAGAGVLVVAEQALVGADFQSVSDFLDQQPAWSDIPLLVLTTRHREPTASWRIVAQLSSVRNAMLLERPMRTEMLVQAARVGLRTRERQYQLRANIAERESLLAQREMLLREVYHRVKNNLQMMQSLVRLSAARAPSQAQPLFTDLASRLGAIGQLHNRIYASGNLTEIDAAAYLGDVVNQIDAAFGALQQRVRLVKRLEPVSVDVDTAMPLGLITTELLTNAYRHAFPAGSTGTIRVELALHAAMAELAVADDGVGMPGADKDPASTGLRLVQALARQIGGTFALSEEAGTRGTVSFPLKRHPPSPS
jgi:two-component sensor histidine kinase